ncbi:MAG: hypothetical protein M1832_000510 [Thelocarpon impressellum]|nr:MAG: hypothetical protein M1832_000510 [Thelocarpon impressellum]
MPSTDRCAELASPSYGNLGLSVVILVGILVSYLPQHHRIVRRRSSEGISPYFVLLGTTSGTCAFANILVLPTSRMDLGCCKVVSGFECFSALLGIAQVGVQWLCFSVILLLFLVYFPRATPLSPPKPAGSHPTYRTALTVTLVCVVHAAITFIISLSFVLLRPSSTATLANILGILATILASIQYFPQLYTTWQLKAVGSLSIPMMLIQTPGSFLWAWSLAARLGSSGWSAWGVYLVTGCLQGSVLSLGIYYEVLKRKNPTKTKVNGGAGNGGVLETNGAPAETESDDEGRHVVEGGDVEQGRDDERTALLRNER